MFEDFAPVTRLLTAFVQSFDEDYACELGSDWEADYDEYIITWSFVMADRSAQSFRDDFIKRFPTCRDFDTFTLSLMHELGHLETCDEMEDDTSLRVAIYAMTDRAKADEVYYGLHNERIATDWAGWYLTAHHDRMKAWEQKILESLKKVLDKYPDV